MLVWGIVGLGYCRFGVLSVWGIVGLGLTEDPRASTGDLAGAAVGGKANLFFSATPGDTLPFVGAWRQMPEVDAQYNQDFQREEYVTTCRYGLKLYRPENLVTVISEIHV